MNSSTPAVSIDGVVKKFGSVTAVDNLSLDIHPGEVVAFLGPNGAGKTTTVDMILGLSNPTSGTVEVFGGDPRHAIALGRVAAVMQTGGLLKDFTVRETVELTASLFRPARPVDEVLDRAGILEIGDRLVGKASGGQQQRLRFALALLSDPDLLILDEPTTGMDVQGRRDFWNAIRSDAERGRTTVFATHYLEEADAYADRIVLVRRGKIVADGTSAEIKAMAAGRTVRATLEGADTAALAKVEGVDSVDVRGESVLIHGSDSDAIARYLLNHTTARDLEITSRNLEEAFVALTADDAPIAEGALA
ncbi:MAG: type transport system ATP-binding protein [Nocardioidaceae bacterium]|nr:type transport system ATP-binding protein [Nocardioidaceae bacterium]